MAGHTRPLVGLAAHMVKLRPVDVTLITTSAFYDRVKNELARHFETGEEEYSQHIRCVPPRHPWHSRAVMLILQCRVISIGDVAFLSLGGGEEAFKKLWHALASEEEVVCASSGARLPPLTKPQAIILDVRDSDYRVLTLFACVC